MDISRMSDEALLSMLATCVVGSAAIECDLINSCRRFDGPATVYYRAVIERMDGAEKDPANEELLAEFIELAKAANADHDPVIHKACVAKQREILEKIPVYVQL